MIFVCFLFFGMIIMVATVIIKAVHDVMISVMKLRFALTVFVL